jgi:segregation and condensation protein B
MGNSPANPQQPTPADSAGMSLDQLSQAFAAMLGQADDSSSAPLVVVGDPILAPEEADRAQLPRVPGAGTSAAEATADNSFPINPRSILEAMLFVGRPDNSPLTSEQMAGLMRGVNAAEIDALVLNLNAQYAAHGCAYTIVSDGAGYRLVLRPEFGSLRERMLGRARAARLSPAAVEVLALIAYNEPLTIAEVTRLRGTPSGHILRHLVRRRLLRLERGDAKPSHAKYFTTHRFLDVFNLHSLEDLPRSDDLARH